MKTEEELLAIEKKQIKRGRTTAAVFGVLAIAALISFVYAFFQHEMAARIKFETSAQLELCQKLAEEAEARADLANKKLEQFIIDAAISNEVKKTGKR